MADNDTPTYPLGGRTLIFDVVAGENLAWIDGLLPLPEGARIRMTNPHGSTGTFDAIVQQVGTLPFGVLNDHPIPVSLQLDVVLEQVESPSL